VQLRVVVIWLRSDALKDPPNPCCFSITRVRTCWS
jgi:hypothetical protein